MSRLLIVGTVFLVYAHALDLHEGAACVDRGVPGTCRLSDSCPSYSILAQSQDNADVTVCSRDGKNLILCCTDCVINDASKGEVTLDGIVWKTGGVRKSYDKCVEYAANLPYSCKDGKIDTPKKVYDEEKKCHRIEVDVEKGARFTTKKIDFPNLAILGNVNNVTEPPSWSCHGFIISERFIVSTAHCLQNTIAGPVTYVAVGVDKRLADQKTEAPASWQVYKVKRTITHPKWRSPNKYNDIGLLETETEIKFGVNVLPMCLSEQSSIPETVEADVWGVGTGDNRKVKIEKLDDKECSEQFGPHRHLVDGINYDIQACYKGFNEAEETCRGSSGRPIYIPGELKCMNYAVGFTAFGLSCKSKQTSSVYTRIPSYVPWIESVVWP